MPRLDFYIEYELFVKVKVGAEAVLIGRGSDCDIQLPNERVSRHHARIEPQPDGLHAIVDLSTNGTRLNSEMLAGAAALGAGDRIYIEGYVIVYQPDDALSEELDEEDSTNL